MTRKWLLILLIGLLGLFFFYKLAGSFAPGSYPYAEHYELDYPEEKVIAAINRLKMTDQSLIVPKVTIQGNGQWDLNDGKEKETEHWYSFYFYNREKNQIWFTWTRSSGRNKTTFAFVAVNDGLDLGNWKDINKDFGFFENRKIKKSFEEIILKRVKANLEIDK